MQRNTDHGDRSAGLESDLNRLIAKICLTARLERITNINQCDATSYPLLGGEPVVGLCIGVVG